jgi:hypothetical protein
VVKIEVGTVVVMQSGVRITVLEWLDHVETFYGEQMFYDSEAIRPISFVKTHLLKRYVKEAIMPEGKLKVFLKAVGNTVIFKVLEQDESLRSKNNELLLYFKASANTASNLAIASNIYPNISVDVIYLQGFYRERDLDVGSLQLKTDQEAREFVVKAKAALAEFAANNYFEGRTLETPVVDADIFWV